ncbi:MAG: hypothetical protein KAS21_02935 [Candidatus Aminicenantes bacterium]|nr:hypothetical protein [Candidatus Aminicenantes bacterium]
MNRKNKYSSGSILTGSVFIFIGVIWVLRNLGHIDISLREWWPLILIAVGLLNISNHRDIFSFPGWFLILLGVIFLLTTNHIIEWDHIKRFWPAILIVIGLSLLKGNGKKIKRVKDSVDKDNYISGLALFSGFERKVSSKSFRGGNITALFGGAEIDLRNAKISPDGASLDLIALFGGVEVRLPDEWNIELNSTALFGGVGNKCKSENPGDGEPLIISATAIFGGVEIKN